MNITFSKPLINQNVLDEIYDTLNNTGWLTSGPKVNELELLLKKINNRPSVCVNSWTSGAMLVLKWFNVGQGDEVIIPSYTYSATALCVLNIGAKPVMVDVNDDFTINPKKIEEKITSKTKAIIPVDIAGLPCDYKSISDILCKKSVLDKFIANGEKQIKLNRILIIGDCAHSIGAKYLDKPIGMSADFSIFSFHSVKNITTGEGGAVCINLPSDFNNDDEYNFLKIFSLNGQTKSAFQKNLIGSWRYDIVAQGLKINMPDICAAIGLAQIKLYLNELLPERKKIFNCYNRFFSNKNWAIVPIGHEDFRESSYHLYMLRIKNISEEQRDLMIDYISKKNVGVNVHYIPMPLLTLFKQLGYNMEDYPNTYRLYSNEISLPIYNGLGMKEVLYVCKIVEEAYGSL